MNNNHYPIAYFNSPHYKAQQHKIQIQDVMNAIIQNSISNEPKKPVVMNAVIMDSINKEIKKKHRIIQHRNKWKFTLPPIKYLMAIANIQSTK